jgi:acetyl esterase/lipase
MSLDPQAELIINLVKQAGLPEFWQLTPPQAREQYAQRVKRSELKESIHRTEDRRIPGLAGDIPIRIYWPRAAKAAELFPVLMWFHGGGFVIGDLDTHDSACRLLANQSDCMVVAVDYRLAPEFKFPAAVEDCYAATRWVALHAQEIGADPLRIAVGGDSAGANLATVMAILARNDGHPKLVFQLLVYPCVAPEPETPSHRKFADGYLLTRNNIVWFYKQYLRNQRDKQDFRFAPLVADDLSNLPPALVFVAGYDPLRDEGVEYVKRLIEAGNRVTLANYEGMVHGFILAGGVLDAAKHAIAESSAALKGAFAEAAKR